MWSASTAGTQWPTMPDPLPARDEKMRLIFEHPCGVRRASAVAADVLDGAWCPYCDPDTGADDFSWPSSGGWRQIFKQPEETTDA